MNAYGLTRDSVPADGLPCCAHGHEVCRVWSCGVGRFVVRCEQCRDIGADVDPQELIRRLWILADIPRLGIDE